MKKVKNSSRGLFRQSRYVIGLCLTYKKLLRELTFVVVEARIRGSPCTMLGSGLVY